MSQREGDKSKKPPECRTHEYPTRCPHLKETGGGFEGERYRCDRCGESFFLDYEEMK